MMTGVPTVFDRVLPLNLIANTVIFFVAARLYLLPLVSRLRPQQILVPILLLHSTRHLGMMFLTRGATYPGLPPEFAYPAAFGDLVTAIIAFAAIPLVLRGSRFARPIVWVFNVFGTGQSRPGPFTTQSPRWGQRTGSPLFGFHCYW